MTTKAEQILLEEIEAAELEGSFEADSDILDLIKEHKKWAEAEKAASVQKKAISELIKEKMVKGNMAHLTHNGVNLTTLYYPKSNVLMLDALTEELNMTENDFKKKFYTKKPAENPTLKVL